MSASAPLDGLLRLTSAITPTSVERSALITSLGAATFAAFSFRTSNGRTASRAARSSRTPSIIDSRTLTAYAPSRRTDANPVLVHGRAPGRPYTHRTHTTTQRSGYTSLHRRVFSLGQGPPQLLVRCLVPLGRGRGPVAATQLGHPTPRTDQHQAGADQHQSAHQRQHPRADTVREPTVESGPTGRDTGQCHQHTHHRPSPAAGGEHPGDRG